MSHFLENAGFWVLENVWCVRMTVCSGLQTFCRHNLDVYLHGDALRLCQLRTTLAK